MPDDIHSGMNGEMHECLHHCEECHDICLQTITHCLTKGGPHAAADHIRLLLDCVSICHTSADFMLRGSPLHKHTCRGCAEVCTKCAEDCEGMGEDEQMRKCAEACRRCAETCRKMAA